MKYLWTFLTFSVFLFTAGCGSAGSRLLTSTRLPSLSDACSHTALPNGLLVSRLGVSRRQWKVNRKLVFDFRATVCNLGPALTVSGSPNHGLRYRLQFQHNARPTFTVTVDAAGQRQLFYETRTQSAYRTTKHFWSLISRATGLTDKQLFR